MSWFEEGNVYTDGLFASHCLAWWRYIDDAFLLWWGDLASLHAFRDAINEAHDDIKFTINASLQEIAFLDVTVIRAQDNRGYPQEILDTSLTKARENLRRTTNRNKTEDRQHLVFVGQYHSQSDNFQHILWKHWHLLRDAYPTILEFEQKPMISFRKGCNIGTKVTQAEIAPSPRQYTFMGPPKEATFTNPTTNRENKIRGHYSCDTSFAVYMLVCPCNLVYVGETTQKVRDRFSQHRSTVNTCNSVLPVSKH
ncbi:hypothetical protein XELAEV_18046503mg [Xenopus laevis]|uniref:GIY-YIG domain-containing protein n=1 Tax=Xenopus laevis TaxID=8355 RepID=A0A974BTF4_XENLA|nr:hypothetical protein XELAEV_18046503mg [Xenopus laevis]